MKKQHILFLVIGLAISIASMPVQAQIQKGADIDGGYALDYSGTSVSMPDANTIAIGTPFYGGSNAGKVGVFVWSGTAWVQKGSNILGETGDDRSGSAVSMADANTIAIGAYLNDGFGPSAGHVRVYLWTGTAWQQKGLDIDGEADYDLSGCSVSMPDANTVAIGAVDNDYAGSKSGHVRIFKWGATGWEQKGVDIDGEAAGDNSGCSVSMPDSNTVAIGARENDGGGTNAGHVRLYAWNGTAWMQKGADIDGEAADDESGTTVSMPDANTVAIGAEYNDGNGAEAGHVRIYKWNGTAWVQKGIDIDGLAAGDYFGNSVSMPDSNTIAVGAYKRDANVVDDGQVRIFKWSGTAWLQLGNNINGEAANDQLGSTVSMPDSITLGSGAPFNDGGANDAGHARVYTMCPATTATQTITACDSLVWIDGITYYANNSTATWTINNAAGCDSLISLDLTIEHATYITDNLAACDSLIWRDGVTYYAHNNTATHTITSATVCDTVVSLNLSIWSVSDITTTLFSTAIKANNNSASSYQWLDCNNNYAVIAGETNQLFYMTTGGSYAVELTEFGCVDTSDCVIVTFTGINDGSLADKFSIYPNPTDGKFSIEFSSIQESISVRLLTVLGQELQSEVYHNTQSIQVEIEQADGIYILELFDHMGNKAVVRLIKE
jgi:Secretion system C-terminal sorting domain/FG-GAP repeat